MYGSRQWIEKVPHEKKILLVSKCCCFYFATATPNIFLHKEITFLPSCQISVNTSESECFYLPLFITDRYKLAVKFWSIPITKTWLGWVPEANSMQILHSSTRKTKKMFMTKECPLYSSQRSFTSLLGPVAALYSPMIDVCAKIKRAAACFLSQVYHQCKLNNCL